MGLLTIYLSEFLRGRFDPGADMIRKVMGIKDETHKQSKFAQHMIELNSQSILSKHTFLYY